MTQNEPGVERTPVAEEHLEQFKEYLSEPRFRIKLDDMVNTCVRQTLHLMSDEKFPRDTTGRISGEDFTARLKAYEEVVKPLQSKAVLLGKWATTEQRATLTNMLAHFSDSCNGLAGGTTLWQSLRWYPVSLLMYSAGISALAAENYPAFVAIHTKKIHAPARGTVSGAVDILRPVVSAMIDVAQSNAWKCVEEYSRKRTPESEHLFKVLKPALDELLFLGAEYEQIFDRYEILRALIYADVIERGWGPVGRFGWKYCARIGQEHNPYTVLLAEAAQQRDQWGPIKAGLFRGSYAHFQQTAEKFENELLRKLEWY